MYYGTQLSTLIRSGVGYKHSLTFIYDDAGQALGFYYDTNLNDSNPGTKYYYVCNAQGDVLQLRDHTNAPVANYYYDSWGKLLGITDANGNAITAFNSVAVLNPIRYRGYFYDTETGFYYLNSRYYDPQIGRFINADGYVSTGQSFVGYNMFAYCNNNPVMLSDPTGACSLFVIPALSIVCAIGILAYCTYITATSSLEPPSTPSSQNSISPQQTGPIMPIEGGVFQNDYPYYAGTTEYHAGTDIPAPNWTPIYAAFSGTILPAETHWTYGVNVVVKSEVNGQQYAMIYAHMQEDTTIVWDVGQSVNAGDIIGYVGDSGYTTGSHLHFETRLINEAGQYPYRSSNVNPQDFFK